MGKRDDAPIVGGNTVHSYKEYMASSLLATDGASAAL